MYRVKREAFLPSTQTYLPKRDILWLCGQSRGRRHKKPPTEPCHISGFSYTRISRPQLNAPMHCQNTDNAMRCPNIRTKEHGKRRAQSRAPLRQISHTKCHLKRRREYEHTKMECNVRHTSSAARKSKLIIETQMWERNSATLKCTRTSSKYMSAFARAPCKIAREQTPAMERNRTSACATETKNSGAQRKKRRQARSQKTKQPMHMQTHEQERARARKSLRAQ